ncbi:unnamed protein product [Bubo scandiacus]
MRSALAAWRACAVTCWPPPPPPSAGTSGSPHARPHGRSPAVLCSSLPLPLLPPPPQRGRLRRCRHPRPPLRGAPATLLLALPPAERGEAAAPAPAPVRIAVRGAARSLLRLQEDTTNRLEAKNRVQHWL